MDFDGVTASRVTDAFAYHCGSNLTPCDVLQYWHDHHLDEPDLARFAFDMLAIPLMSDVYERTFSSAKHLLSDAKNRMNMDLFEANECLKNEFGKPHSADDIKLKFEVNESTTDLDSDAQERGNIEAEMKHNEKCIALVMKDIKVQFQEDKAVVQNGCTEISSGEDDGCEGLQFTAEGEAIIDDIGNDLEL